MANIDVKQIRVAKRYSDALIENAINNGEVDKILDELSFVNQTLVNSPDLKEFLENPIITHQDKLDVINEIFTNHLSNPVMNLLKLLVENNRFDVFESILIEYSNKKDEINNIIKAKIVSAVDLNDEAKSKIVAKLEQRTSKKVAASYEINPDIVAGLIVEINDKTIDTSLKTKLNNIKKQLI